MNTVISIVVIFYIVPIVLFHLALFGHNKMKGEFAIGGPDDRLIANILSFTPLLNIMMMALLIIKLIPPYFEKKE